MSNNNEPAQSMSLPAEIRHLLEENYLRVQPPVAFQRIWQRLITAAEKQQLHNEIRVDYDDSEENELQLMVAVYSHFRGSVGVWIHLHQLTQHAAILDLAHKLNFLSESDADWLRRELEIPDLVEQQPNWNPATGKLKWGSQIIRQVKVHAQPSKIQQVLDAFEEEGWPATIYDPLTNGPDPQRLHDTVKSLNNSLSVIRFHATSSGECISWERCC